MRSRLGCGILVDPDEGHRFLEPRLHFLEPRLEETMTILLNPDRGPHRPSIACARVLLAARVAA